MKAIERLRRLSNGEGISDVYPHDGITAMNDAMGADAIRVVMDELDPTPVDLEFVESLGWLKAGGIYLGPLGVSLCEMSTGWHLQLAHGIKNPTRGQVRTLLRLLTTDQT